MPTLSYDSVTCSRCGGSGQYSFCTMHGTTCFKCGGRGTVLSAIGKQAAAQFRELVTVPAASVRVGELVVSHVGLSDRRAFFKVTAVENDEHGRLCVSLNPLKAGQMPTCYIGAQTFESGEKAVRAAALATVAAWQAERVADRERRAARKALRSAGQ